MSTIYKYKRERVRAGARASGCGRAGAGERATCVRARGGQRTARDGLDAVEPGTAANGSRKAARKGPTPQVGDTRELSEKVDKAEQLVYTQLRFKAQPSRKLARKALALSDQCGEWNGLSLAGKYVRLYEIKYSAPWRGSLSSLVDLVSDLGRLHKDKGSEAVVAIDAAFSPALKWATNPLILLMSQDYYVKYVVPAIHSYRQRTSGEQSEWKGERTNERGSRPVDF